MFVSNIDTDVGAYIVINFKIKTKRFALGYRVETMGLWCKEGKEWVVEQTWMENNWSNRGHQGYKFVDAKNTEQRGNSATQCLTANV